MGGMVKKFGARFKLFAIFFYHRVINGQEHGRIFQGIRNCMPCIFSRYSPPFTVFKGCLFQRMVKRIQGLT